MAKHFVRPVGSTSDGRFEGGLRDKKDSHSRYSASFARSVDGGFEDLNELAFIRSYSYFPLVGNGYNW